ncbi:hypothetical protein [Salinibacterium sp. SWN1162]|uniref:hypothetical protein n=1 Tax=Salinibacterium sp. SWN1162 TaxID=2792053 RepID=UPI0018CF5A90|nr:hypothetical protein [Salinibacterium sp. SWN1162]MBH0009034.1 hypothetical protein [Salinibacterium sp. SWN1162]
MESESKFRRDSLPQWALILWFVLAFMWFMFFVVLHFNGYATNEWQGIVSNIPLFGFLIYKTRQDLRHRDQKKAQHNAK